MPRPRVHDPHRLVDTAEQLIAEVGISGLTVRALAATANVPNGTIYHAFGSMGALVAQVWLRAAGDFLDLQTELVDRVLGGTTVGFAAAVDAVIAAADATAVFAERRLAAARMLLTVKNEQLLCRSLPIRPQPRRKWCYTSRSAADRVRLLSVGLVLGPHLPDDLAGALLALDKRVVSLLVRLTHLVWKRRDAPAVEVLTTCVVDLPAAFFRRTLTAPGDPHASPIDAGTRSRLAAAVRAVLADAPPPRRTHGRTR